MRKWLFAVVLLLLVAPAFAERPLPEGCVKAPENNNGRLECMVYIKNYGHFVREVDPVGWRVAPDYRRWKVSLGIVGSNRIRTTAPSGDFSENIGEGSFLQMLGSAVSTWLNAKDGQHTSRIGVGNGSAASLSLLTGNPQAFAEGESFIMWRSLTPRETSREGAGLPMFEFRPRLGGWESRWRLGLQVAFSDELYSISDASMERIDVNDVTVSPYSPQLVRITGSLGRSIHREDYRTNQSSWQITAGPEFELVHGGPVDLSVEAGYAYLHYRAEGTSNLYSASYLVFAPEVFVPDVDPTKLLEGGETPLTTRVTTRQSRHRLYAGLRADVFPFGAHHVGINAGVRWYTGDLPYTRTFAPELTGPFDTTVSATRWVATVGLTLAWTHGQ